MGESLKAGKKLRDPNRAVLDIFAGGAVGIGAGMGLTEKKAELGAALYIGGMGARSKNFYNDIFSKSGYAEEAKLIQDLYLSGKKDAAAAAIPDDYLAKVL